MHHNRALFGGFILLTLHYCLESNSFSANLNKKHQLKASRLVIGLISLFTIFNAAAEEGFRTHYSPTGLITGETAIILEDRPGFFGTISGSLISIDQINDANGNNAANQSLYVNSPPAFSTLYQNATGSNTLNVNQTFSQTQRQVNFIGGYVTSENYWGGKFVGAVSVPYVTISRQVSATVDPTQISQLQAYASANPASAPTINQMISSFKSQAASVAASKSGNTQGFGDTNLIGTWSYFNGHNTKYLAGLTIIAPTGSFDQNSPVNVGFGYFTFLPSMAAFYQENNWTFAGRASYGYNTSNSNTSYKSGDFVAFELFGSYKVLGLANFGLNITQLNQITADTYTGPVTTTSTTQNPGGTSALLGTTAPIDGGQQTSYTALTPSVVVPFPSIGGVLTLQYTWMPLAKDSLHANFMQARFTKHF